MDIYNINLLQKITEEYAIMIYYNSKLIADIPLGMEKQEAMERAQQIKNAFEKADINDQT